MSNSRPPLISLPLVATCLALAATLAIVQLTARRKPELLVQPLSSISPQIMGFEAGVDNPPLADSVLRQLRPTSYLARSYRTAGLAADLLIAFYAQQRAGESM